MRDRNELAESDFLRLFVRHEEALRAYARALVPTWESVDEVMQEASVVMWKKREQLEDEAGFLPWAKVIVRMDAMRLRRDVARDRHVFGDEVMELLANEAEEVSESHWEEQRAALQTCLQQMAPHHRDLLMAPYSRDGEVMRLAEGMGRSVNSLYKLLGRLREKLVQCMEQRLAEEGGLR